MALGDTAQAMRCYERLWQVLDEDLDVEPSEKTQGALRRDQAGPAPAGRCRRCPAPDLLAPIAILVEPTQALDLPGDFGYFGAIFRDEMIGALARFRDWLVIDGEQGGTTPPTYRAYILRISLHGRDGSILVGDAPRRPGRRPPRLVRAPDRDARRHGRAAPHRAAPPRGRAQRPPVGAAPAVRARDREPDGPQVRALDAGPGADGRVAGRVRGARRGDPARPDRDHARPSPRRWSRWRRSCTPGRSSSPACGAGPST